MNRLPLLMLGLSLLSLGCSDPIYPSLCVDLSHSPGNPLGEGGGGGSGGAFPKTESKCSDGFFVSDGEGFIVRHQLPDGIETEETLHITVETPCKKLELEQKYTASATNTEKLRIARIPVVAPPGASCSLVITASIANHRAQLTSATQSCADIASRCEPEEEEQADAGAEDAATEDASTEDASAAGDSGL